MKKSIKTKVLSLVASFAMVLSLLVLPIGVHAEGEQYVAEVNGEKYESLENAVKVAKINDCIKLINDVNESITVQQGDVISLDLNGYTMIGKPEKGIPAILNNGNLTIKDSSKNTTGKITRDTTNGSYYVIDNQGTMTILNGQISIKSPDTMPTGSSLIRNAGSGKTATLNVKGGYLFQDGFIALKNDDLGILNISGGEIKTRGDTVDKTASAIQNWGEAHITGGEIGNVWVSTWSNDFESKMFISGNASITGKMIVKQEDSYNGKVCPYVEISNGKFDVQWNVQKEKTTIKIFGGTFNNDVSDYVVGSHKTFKQSDGTYKVAPKANSLEIDCDFAELEVGETLQLNTVIGPDGTLENVVWSSSDDKVATVDENGCVNSLAPGKVIITAKAGDVSDTCEITVYEVEEPTLPKEDIQVNEEAKEVIGNTTTTIVDAVKKDEEVKNVEFVDENAKEALKNAQVVTTEVATKQLTEDKVEKTIVTAIDNKVKEINKTNKTEGEVVQYLDLSVLLNADGETVGHITELEDKIEFTVPVPKDLQKDGVNFYVVRVHDGQVERLEDCVYDAKTGIVTFSTDKFSTYALVSEVKASSNVVVTPEKPKPTDKEDKPVDTNKPTEKEETVKTDDENNMTLYASFAGLALVGVAILVLTKKREEFMK